VIIDECHRSGWGDWSTVLRSNSHAIQVGLTATPRQLANAIAGDIPGAAGDAQITADNLRYFGDPVYEYDLGQGIEDGFLAACEIVRRDIFLQGSPFAERETGLDRDDLASARSGTPSPARRWRPNRRANTTAPGPSRTGWSCPIASRP